MGLKLLELINCLMLTVCNRISLDSIWHIQIYCLGVDIYSCIVIVIHSFDNSDMTSPNSLIFFFLVRVSQRHTLDATLSSG